MNKKAILVLTAVVILAVFPDSATGLKRGCRLRGKWYKTGQMLPVDSCTQCVCMDHVKYICRNIHCDPTLICEHNWQWYRAGDIVPKDTCNTCTCQPTGTINCTDKVCNTH